MLFNNRKSLIARFAVILTLLGGMLGTTPVQADSIIYRVAPDGSSDPACGADWANPCDLQYALTTLASAGDELWVKQGSYQPGNTRTSTFQLKNGVRIYGGFAGTEVLFEERDPAINLTILSGDIGVSDDNSDNTYHVVTGSGTAMSAIDTGTRGTYYFDAFESRRQTFIGP